MARAHDFGRRAEDAAAAHLRANGWRILDRNWRFRHKEIDLVVEQAGLVAFVEVKARGPDPWGDPLAAITRAKRRELALAARAWIATRGRPYHAFRFDAVAVRRERGAVHVDHVEDAWRL